MRALRITAWKHQPELLEIPDPDPGPGQVRVKVGGAGLCHSDLHLLHEFDDGMVPWGPPFTLGHENAGWVDAVGAGVTGLEPGEPVAVYGAWGCGRCGNCSRGFENYCERQNELGTYGGGLGDDGGMAPYLLVPDARFLVPLGDVDPADAAPLTDAGLTPYHAIKRSLPLLGAGTHAVVIGVGGLGHLAVQILAAMSATTIVAVDARSEALQLAKSTGAHVTVLSGEQATAQIMDATKGRGAEAVFDFVGADATLALAGSVSRAMGHVTCVGIAGGTFPFSFFSQPYEVSLATTYWGSRPELMEVLALAAAGHLKPEVHRFDLDGAADAYRMLADGKLTGRGVVVP